MITENESAVKITDGLLEIALAIGMSSNKAEHKDVCKTPMISVRLQSLLWMQAFGRFRTEDDEVCEKCSDCKPAAHHTDIYYQWHIHKFEQWAKKIYAPFVSD